MNTEQIRAKMEDVIRELYAHLSTAHELDVRGELLNQQDRENRNVEKRLQEEIRKIEQQQIQLKREKEFIDKTNKELSVRELALEEDKKYIKEAEEAEKELLLRKQEIINKKLLVEDKIKELEKLQQKETELEEREAMVEKANMIDAERKRLLDVREEHIHNKEIRLQIDSEE
jgi:hypothetical protein